MKVRSNLLSHLSTLMLCFSNKLWHLLQCKLLDDKGDSVLVADPIFNSSYEGIKEDLKAIGIKG